MEDNAISLTAGRMARKDAIKYFSARRYSALIKLLKSSDLTLSHIFDVGVRAGTPGLYKSFPGVRFVLFDPQEKGESILKSKPRDYCFRNVALGAMPGRMYIDEMGGKSSFKQRTELTAGKIASRYEAEICTLDDEIQKLDCSLLGIKIDTEGYELEVVSGLEKEISRVVFIQAEVSLKNRFINSYSFSEFVSHLNSKGFVLAGILNHGYGRLPNFHDVIFLRQSLFRDY
jgi:FkbM family methyltransferase